MRTAAALVVLVALVALTGAAGGGIPTPPPPGDTNPTWSPDGSVIAFLSDRDGASLRVVNADGTDEHRIPWLPASSTYAFSPDWSHVAAVIANPPGELGAQLVVERLDGSERLSLGPAVYGTRPTWSPDGTRVAFVAASATPNRTEIVVARVDGSEAHAVALGSNPAWSPVDDRIVYVSNWDAATLHVVHADGTGDAAITARSAAWSGPRWSPDGTRLVAARSVPGRPGDVEVLHTDGSLIANLGRIVFVDDAWSPRGDAIAFAAVQGVLLVDAASGRRRRLTTFYASQLAWSPDGRHLALAAGGACRDRLGIYAVGIDRPAPVRLTNDCRIVGTPGDDVLVGTPLSDVLVGQAGNDTLRAVSAPFGGDTLDGGPGNDLLVGSLGRDSLTGGPGSDILRGGPGPDLLVGGPGRDVLEGQGGRDLIEARDGQRDVVSCGTNTSRTTGPEGDIAYVDRSDRVLPGCEWVYRPGPPPPVRGRISFRITIFPQGNLGRQSPRRTYTLRCRPDGGTLPQAQRACSRLLRVENPFAPISPAQPCALFNTDFVSATVRGVYGGDRVSAVFDRLDSCAMGRWDRVAFLFPIQVEAAPH